MGSEHSPIESDESQAGRGDSVEAERAFDAPWQARAFAVAVAMTREGEHSWGSFQERLAAEVERDEGDEETLGTVSAEDGIEGVEEGPEDAYYEQWLGALSRLLIESDTLTADEVAARTQEFAAGERTAEEWVEGDRDHTHGAGHAHDEHGHPHDH